MRLHNRGGSTFLHLSVGVGDTLLGFHTLGRRTKTSCTQRMIASHAVPTPERTRDSDSISRTRTLYRDLRLKSGNILLSNVFTNHLQSERFFPRSRALATRRDGRVAQFGNRQYILTCWQARHNAPSTDDRLLLIILMRSVNQHASQVLVLLRTQQRLWPSTPRLLHISGRKLPRDSESHLSFARFVVQYRPTSALRKPPCSQHLTQSWRRHVHVPQRERLRHLCAVHSVVCRYAQGWLRRIRGTVCHTRHPLHASCPASWSRTCLDSADQLPRGLSKASK